EKARSNPLWKLLTSLSIKHTGKKASKLLAMRVNSVWQLAEWTEEDFTQIKDIGLSVAQSVMTWFSDPENIAMLKNMEQYGVNMLQTGEDKPVAAVENAVFSGKTILFT
ncbi:helix-hairpin-helix domain-containing protein, partial [Arthrospira platensis SPKY1]|nr:helix-hairpin-helix domain-containing protein [Arthrospira platensis SPKY1]